MEQEKAAMLHNWFRETLLVLESRVSGLAPAASFQLELVYMGPMTNDRDWVLAEGQSDSAPQPALMEPVKSLGQTIPVEMFVNAFCECDGGDADAVTPCALRDRWKELAELKLRGIQSHMVYQTFITVPF